MSKKGQNTIPVDDTARKKIVLELEKTFLVEAGAGSGKTKSLVDRMIALLKNGQCRIDTLAAVTFTRKAAAELRGRFQTELERELREGKGDKVRQRLKEALQNLEQCTIGTIHSFCAKLIRERPVEISLDPEFQELEEIEDAIYRDKCWHEFLIQVRLKSDPLLERLDSVGLTPEELKGSFIEVCRFPEVELMPGTTTPPDYVYYRKKLEALLDDAGREIPKDRPAKGYDELMRFMRRCFFRQRNLGLGDHPILMETYEILEKDPEFKITYWPDKEKARAFHARFQRFQDEVVKPALQEWREYRHCFILDFIKPAVEFYSDRRREQGQVNYGDLLMYAARLLRDNPEVRDYFQRKFTHIMVDEFQDTDPIQAEMLMYLTGTDKNEGDWKKLNPRKGSLFLVGDPKQSIYRFRRADIDIYNLVKDRIQKTGGEVLELTANFRSLPSIRDWINPVFHGIFPKQFTPYQAAYASLDTVREEKPETKSGVYKISIGSVSRNNQKQIAEIDAGIIGDYIRWACEGHVKLARTPGEQTLGIDEHARPEDFLILLRYKKQMQAYARALEERGLPYEIAGSGAFSESEEIREIVNLIQALNDPNNPIYTVAVLRGIFFGISDNELLAFKRNGGKFSYMKRRDNAEEGDQQKQPDKVEQALQKLHHWWTLTQKSPVSTSLEMILESTGILPFLAGSDMGSSRAGNLIKLMEIVRTQENMGKTSFAEIAEFTAGILDLYEIEEMSLTPARTNAVRIMNLHKAKGLEAPVVFLANPLGTREHPPSRHVERIGEEGPKGYFVFNKPRGEYLRQILSQPINWDKKAEEEKKYQDAEEKRLMYVASTRAKNLLVISTYERKSTNRAWEALDDNLADVPELGVPIRDKKGERETLKLSADAVEKGRRDIQSHWLEASKPSYAVDTVTSQAKKDIEIPIRQQSGYGMSWGRMVHALLESVGRGTLEAGFKRLEEKRLPENKELSASESMDALDILIENALTIEEWDPSEKPALRNLIDSILASEFWKRALKAKKRFVEVPFSLKASGSELGRKDKLPVILTGVIDLVFQESGGWVIADYKSDEVGGPEHLQSLLNYYSPQVKLYSRFWAEITGETVKETGLFFIDLNRWIPVV